MQLASDTDYSPEEIENGRKLFAGSCEFLMGGVNMASLPASELAEAAFAGRSNVGKSSLINALTGRKALARASHTPGRTRELNFFRLADQMMLVDLPGYGYAEASKSRIKAWTALTRDYLRGRAQLRRVCLLIDARHGLKSSDHDIMALFDEAAVVFQIILTKADKVKSQELDAVAQSVAAGLKAHPAAHPRLIATSSHKGAGIAFLRAELAALCTG